MYWHILYQDIRDVARRLHKALKETVKKVIYSMTHILERSVKKPNDLAHSLSCGSKSDS